MRKTAGMQSYRGAVTTVAGAFGEVATIAMRLGRAGRLHDEVRRLNGMTDTDLDRRGLTRSGEVDRIFG